MASKHTLVTITIIAVLLFLTFGQASTWRHFSWSVFWNNSRDVSLPYALAAIAMTYTGFVLRAMRWQVFLRPMKQVPGIRLLGPTIIGFTGLALLGRPGRINPAISDRTKGTTEFFLSNSRAGSRTRI